MAVSRKLSVVLVRDSCPYVGAAQVIGKPVDRDLLEAFFESELLRAAGGGSEGPA
jgi:hypothetical protein